MHTILTKTDEKSNEVRFTNLFLMKENHDKIEMMKNRSIRFKITAWFTIVLVLIVTVSFLLIRMVSGTVLHKTMRDYLISSVEANVDQVYAIPSREYAMDQTGGSVIIDYKDGCLEIDDDFLDVIDEVQTALYDENGTLLYGQNPLSMEMAGESFTDTRIRRIKKDGVVYEVYDRRLSVPDADGLWLRGVVPQTQGDQQLADITRITLILLPVLIVIAMAGGYVIAGRLLRPIDRIERAASEITLGTDLKKRIALQGPDDELHRLANTFDGMIARLDASFEAEKFFMSEASHKLRTPLTVMISQCEYTLEKERSTEEYEDALRTIRRHCVKMSGQVADMLAFTRAEMKIEERGQEENNMTVPDSGLSAGHSDGGVS